MGKENRILKFPITNYYWKKIQYFEERSDTAILSKWEEIELASVYWTNVL
jgi:hypothetical protein